MRFTPLFFLAFSLLLNPSISSAQSFTKIAEIDVGGAPHGMRVHDGKLFLAAAGDDAIEIIDLKTLKITDRWPVPNTPLDIVRYGDGWLVTEFQGENVLYLNGETGAIEKTYKAGKGPSLFIPEPVGDRRYVVSEFSNDFTIFDDEDTKSYKTGDRPYPADVTKDGVLAFIPNRDEDTVSVIDLLNEVELTRVSVCDRPEGGMLTRDQISYIVVCNGDDRINFINTASFEITKAISEGIGPKPFSIAISKSGRYAFVNNAGGVDVSVIDLEMGQVIERLPAGEQPIVVRVEGDRLYVASEVSNTLSIFTIEEPKKAVGSKKNTLFVMGMTHRGHLTSERYGLDKVEEIIRAYNPDYVIAEIPPNRLEAAIKGFNNTGVVTEERTKVFPEYREVLFPLTGEMDFEILGGAAWTSSMNNYRNATAKRLSEDPNWAEARAAMEAANEVAQYSQKDGGDDPYYINSDDYDAVTKESLKPYDHYYNDVYGPGGWTNINVAHYSIIERQLDKLKGMGKKSSSPMARAINIGSLSNSANEMT